MINLYQGKSQTRPEEKTIRVYSQSRQTSQPRVIRLDDPIERYSFKTIDPPNLLKPPDYGFQSFVQGNQKKNLFNKYSKSPSTTFAPNHSSDIQNFTKLLTNKNFQMKTQQLLEMTSKNNQETEVPSKNRQKTRENQKQLQLELDDQNQKLV